MAKKNVVATFYSYKGGVGRTLNLVNTAAELTHKGYSVLVWDMDLEAPGIQNISYFEEMSGDIHGGVVDVVLNLVENGCEIVNKKMIHRYIVTHPRNSKLHLFPAGNLTDENEYSRKFSLIPWEELLLKKPQRGIELFMSIRDILLEKKTDFILIDSRNGYTDLGGICCFKLPGIVFLVFTYSNQNLMGMKGIFESFNNSEWLEKISSCPQLKSYPVASMTMIDRPDTRRDQRETRSKFLPDTFKIYAEIPFNSHMIYKETVWRAEYPNDPFCDYYEPIARILETERQNISRR